MLASPLQKLLIYVHWTLPFGGCYKFNIDGASLMDGGNYEIFV